MTFSATVSTVIFLAALSSAGCHAQHSGPPPGSGSPGGPPPPPLHGGTPGNEGYVPNAGPPPPERSQEAVGTVSTMRGGLQLGPPGRWWDDKHFAKDLGLRPDQQRRMDAVFEEHRATILQRYQLYVQAQNSLEMLTRASVLDEPALMAQIERVGRARIDLEEANTRMMIQILKAMDDAQRARLSSHR